MFDKTVGVDKQSDSKTSVDKLLISNDEINEDLDKIDEMLKASPKSEDKNLPEADLDAILDDVDAALAELDKDNAAFETRKNDMDELNKMFDEIDNETSRKRANL